MVSEKTITADTVETGVHRGGSGANLLVFSGARVPLVEDGQRGHFSEVKNPNSLVRFSKKLSAFRKFPPVIKKRGRRRNLTQGASCAKTMLTSWCMYIGYLSISGVLDEFACIFFFVR